VLSDVNVRLVALDGTKLTFHDVVHVSRLKPCWDDPAARQTSLGAEEEEDTLQPAPSTPVPALPAQLPARELPAPAQPAPALPALALPAPAVVDPADSTDDSAVVLPAPAVVDPADSTDDSDEWIDPADLRSGPALRHELARRVGYVPAKSSVADLRARYESVFKNHCSAPRPNSSFLDKGVVWCVSGIGLDHSSRASAREPAGMFPEFSF